MQFRSITDFNVTEKAVKNEYAVVQFSYFIAGKAMNLDCLSSMHGKKKQYLVAWL